MPASDGQKHDPFDPDYVRSRRKAGPRLVDLSQPLPEPDPGPAVPRPYSPQKRLKPEAIVPPEDNPMSGWRWLGARMLSRTLWPRDALTNPVMAYYTGRRRGRGSEDLFGVAPWALWLAFDLWFMLGRAKSFGQIWSLGVIEFVFAGILAYAWSAIAVALHVRRATTNMPVEEMLLTRLAPVDIVQGLSIRPISVQSAAALFWTLGNFASALMAAWLIQGYVGPAVLAFVLVLVPLRYWFMSVALESGASYAMRAHMCIRSTLTASLRMFMDLALMVFLFLATCGTIALTVGAASWGFKGGAGSPGGGILMAFLALGAIVLVCVLLFAGTSFLFAAMRNLGGDAMEFCCNHPEEWWFRRTDDEKHGDVQARTLFTPWKPTEKGKVVWKATAPPNAGVKRDG